MANTQQYQEENPPFAMIESHPPQHLCVAHPTETISLSQHLPSGMRPNNKKKLTTADSHMSSNSAAPGLVESVMTDGSSSLPSDCDSSYLPEGSSSYLRSPSKFMISSLPTVSSDVGGSSLLPRSQIFGQHENEVCAPVTRSYGFSQLLRAADDTNFQLGHSRMPVVPEHGIVDDSCEMERSGTLISSPDPIPEQPGTTGWLPRFLTGEEPKTANNGLRAPLLPPGGRPKLSQSQSILGTSPYKASLEKAKSSIQSVLEDDQSFEVSMDICSDLSVHDVMNILGNPDLLKLWCDPIESLIVTSSSDETRGSMSKAEADQGREYEGEWIEATTTALESPPSAAGFLFGAGQTVLQTLGFASYGKITMFVERRRGQVGLTVGPFQGGIHASHAITVVQENKVIRLVDRVRLTYEEHETTLSSMLVCGAFDKCLSSCLLPPLGSYVEQVKTSMGRLRLLVENQATSPGGVIISGGTLISVPIR